MHRHDAPGGPHGSADWDLHYMGHAHGPSRERPNEVLEAETQALTPGRALEVGCGEGTDAIWLAANGWRVTATDVSQVALDRAAAAADARGLRVDWRCGAIEDMDLEPGAFDLVVVLYPALPRDRDHVVIDSLIGAVAPGGSLLIVGHYTPDPEYPRSHGFDPRDYIQPTDVVARLDDRWQSEVDEQRERTTDGSHGSPYATDVVLKAYRAA